MKKQTIFKLFAIILCLSMIAAMFSACVKKGNKDESSSKTDTTTSTTDNLYDDNGFLLDSLPNDLKYNNKDFTLFTWSNQTVWEWSSDPQSGDLIKDSLYLRMLNVEERMGVKLVIEQRPGEWENRVAFIQALEASVSTQAGEYDLVGQYTAAAGIGTMKKLYTDLKAVDYLDLEKPWWPSDISDNCTVDEKLYFMTGDISPTSIRAMGTIIANLDMAENLGIEPSELYNLVYDRQWTMEKMQQIALGKTQGYNADGTPAYGFTFNDNVIFDNMLYAGGFKFVENDSEGNLTLSPSINSERMIDWFNASKNFLHNNSDVIVSSIDKTFVVGNSIFHMCIIANVQNFMTQVDFDFAILPTPMVDENQEDYYTLGGLWVTYYSIPTDAIDFSFSGAVTEALASDGYRRTTPTFYEQAFQLRYLQTEENAKMFDILHRTQVFDTVRFFADEVKSGTTSLFATFRLAATDSGASWSTIYSAHNEVWKSTINGIMDKMSK
jgi:hypothetical protein